MYAALVGAINHPDAIHPYMGLFNGRSLRALAHSGTSIDVVSPRPFAPPIGPYSAYASLPKIENRGSYAVHHPRFWYLLPKRLFYGVSGDSYARRVPSYVEETLATPDVVHACHIYPDGYGLLPYVRRHDLPLFVVSHGKLLNSFGNHPPGVSKKIRETLDAASGVLCVSDALASKARELTDSSKVRTVPLGADPEKFPVERKSVLRSELDVDQDAIVVLFVGEFTERKGIKEIAGLLPELELERAEFVFVGHGGELEAELRRAVSESSYSTRHIYKGITSLALRRLFAMADLLVLPSHAEGRPTVIYEAMASETAVLATDVGGIREQVVEGETGAIIPKGDSEALESELVALHDRPEELRQMGRVGKKRLVDQGWTWEDHANRVQTLHRAELDGIPSSR